VRVVNGKRVVGEKRVVSRRRRFPRKTAALIALILAAAALLAMVAGYMWRMNSFTPGAETYHYDVGRRFDHSAAARIHVTDEEGAVLTDGEKNFLLERIPVFYANEDRALLTATMLAVSSEGLQGRLPYFSELLLTEAGPVLRDGNKELPADGGFLFDGGDGYLFMEEGTLEIGEESYALSPGAYVTAVYNAWVEFCPYGAQESIRANVREIDVVARLESGCSVDLGKDILRCGDTELLLFTAPDMIAPLMD
jgi:hypothetical protein